jgi:hypothetical protein
MVLSAYHDPDSDAFEGIHKKVVIEDYVWIATRAMILPGVTIWSWCCCGCWVGGDEGCGGWDDRGG